MKKVVSILSIFAATVAIASSVQSDNTFGVLKLDIGTATGQTIISVPWENVGGGAVDVNKIMLTNNLAIDDKLYYFNTSSKHFQVWALTAEGWQAQSVVTENLEAAQNDQKIPRGAALIIERNTVGARGDVYLYGQYVASTGNSTVAAATADSDVYSLIAPCGTGAVVLNAVTWTGAEVGDTISHGTHTYSWDGTSWYYEENGTGQAIHIDGSGGNTFTPPNKVTAITIPAGQGVWYKRSKGQASFTIEW